MKKYGLQKYTFPKATIVGVFIISLFFYGCTHDYDKQLSGGYLLVLDKSGNYIVGAFKKNWIWPKVDSCAWDKDFIVASQNPNCETTKYFLYSEMRMNGDKRIDERAYTDVDRRERFIDSIAKTDPYYAKIFSGKVNYWIIEIKNDQIYGPLSKEEYLKVRHDLRVPKDVKLKTEFE